MSGGEGGREGGFGVERVRNEEIGGDRAKAERKFVEGRVGGERGGSTM